MEITDEIQQLADKAHYTRRELFDLAHSFDVTHPQNAGEMLKQALKRGRPSEPYGKRFHELVEARHKLLKIVERIDGPENELHTLNALILELEPKATAAEQERRRAKKGSAA
jgi:hypothetical protein